MPTERRDQELFGIGITTAIRWAGHACRDWAPYLAEPVIAVHLQDRAVRGRNGVGFLVAVELDA